MLRVLLAWVVGLASLLTQPHAHADAARVIEAQLSTGPHAPSGAPDVVVHVPAHYDPEGPLDVVVFLHGFDGCARALVAAEPVACRRGEAPHRVWDLARLHEQSGTNSILVVPQLAYLARSARGHRFTTHGAFDRMLRELLAGELASVLGPRSLAQLHAVTLVAHSAGYAATLAILGDAERVAPVAHVVLLDALYAGAHAFAAWATQARGRRLVSLYTRQQATVLGNQALLTALGSSRVQRSLEGSCEATVRAHPLVVAQVRTAHGDMPRAHLAEVLRGLLNAQARKPTAAP